MKGGKGAERRARWARMGRSALAVLALSYLMGVKASAEPTVVLVIGAEGTPEYGRMFQVWAGRWRAAVRQANGQLIEIGSEPNAETSDRDRLAETLRAMPAESADELWLVLIGHGTADDRAARFNLRGPDVAATELAAMLEPFKRPLVVIDSSACSGPFIQRLSGADRVVITATRSGNEQNFARFGDYFSNALTDGTADYDRDGQVSLLEAYLAASRRLAEFYRSDARLATEHPLLDDNADGLGTPGDWFRGLRAIKRAREGAPLDGHRARQIALVRSERERNIPHDVRMERDRLELAVAELRDRKESFSDEDEYYAELEPLLVKLALLLERTDGR